MGRDLLLLAVTSALVLWWIDQTLSWPYGGSSPKLSAVRYCVPFVGDMLALTVSILAESRYSGRSSHLGSSRAAA